MDGIAAPVIAALDGLSTELLLLVPIGLAVTAVTWGTPKAIGFFRKIAK